MCLSIPARVKSIDDRFAEVEFGRSIMTVSTELIEGVKPGDYVLVHAGFALTIISPSEAMGMVKMLNEIFESLN